MEQTAPPKTGTESIPILFHSSWHPHVHPLFQTKEMKELKYEILKLNTYYPNRGDIFRVFTMPLKDIKVVILGQDPYSDGRANGLAFAVNEGTKKPFSLRTIEKEVGHELDRTLQPWFNQGVFLLNTALTVERNKPNSHIKYWEFFTKRIIEIISAEVSPIWMLWGSNAKAYENVIRDAEVFLPNLIFKAAHPASEAPNRKGGFIGCNHFELCNQYLKKFNLETINW
jgi:uracil-DNA glycosylase